MAGSKMSGRIAVGQTEIMRLAASNQFVPDACGRQPSVATDTRPGTKSKVDVLAARCALGEPLWSDDDLNTLPTSADFAYNRTAMHTAERYGKNVTGRPPKIREE